MASVEAVDPAEAALTALGNRRFDALLLDIRMPKVVGVERTRLLRRFARPPALIFVTAHEGGAVDAFELEASTT